MNLLQNTRKSLLACFHDLLMAALSFWLSLYLRLGEDFSYAEPALIPGVVIFTTICALVFLYLRVYQGVWRYASIYDLVKLSKGVTIAIICFIPAMFLYNRLEGLPRSVFIINWFVLLALLGGPRFFYRLMTRRSLAPNIARLATQRRIPVLLVGVNDHTELFLRDIVGQPDSQYEVVGLLDNDKSKIGRDIYNIRIFGTTDSVVRVVEKLKKRGQAPQKILFSPGYIDRSTVGKLLEESDRLGLTVARIPKLTEFKAGAADQNQIQPIAVEDLLGRPQAPLDRNSIQQFIRDKRVLVTGAGGTIGSELVRQIAGYLPAHLTLLENSEHGLYQIDKELEETHAGLPRRAIIGDVRNREQLELVFSEATPDIVFHAAALKHVPLSELNADEAILTNALGTQYVADACVTAGVKQMVMISTDKAVNPSNVMGATKRLAEQYVQALGQSKQSKDTSFITVRFGNVLGSTGSVVPLFRRQLQNGGPLTVTDPNMTRYFMTVREAVELVLQASVLAEDAGDDRGVIYVLDMGEPVHIKDLATQMIRLAGFTPGKDIDIVYTGIRPGEKLYEELFYEAEAPERTRYESIMKAKPVEYDIKHIRKAMEKMAKEATQRRTEKSLAALKKLVPEFLA